MGFDCFMVTPKAPRRKFKRSWCGDPFCDWNKDFPHFSPSTREQRKTTFSESQNSFYFPKPVFIFHPNFSLEGYLPICSETSK